MHDRRRRGERRLQASRPGVAASRARRHRRRRLPRHAAGCGHAHRRSGGHAVEHSRCRLRRRPRCHARRDGPRRFGRFGFRRRRLGRRHGGLFRRRRCRRGGRGVHRDRCTRRRGLGRTGRRWRRRRLHDHPRTRRSRSRDLAPERRGRRPVLDLGGRRSRREDEPRRARHHRNARHRAGGGARAPDRRSGGARTGSVVRTGRHTATRHDPAHGPRRTDEAGRAREARRARRPRCSHGSADLDDRDDRLRRADRALPRADHRRTGSDGRSASRRQPRRWRLDRARRFRSG